MADRRSAHSSGRPGPKNRGATVGHTRPGTTFRKVGARPSGNGALSAPLSAIDDLTVARAHTCVKPRAILKV